MAKSRAGGVFYVSNFSFFFAACPRNHRQLVGYCIAKANEHVSYMCIFFVYLGRSLPPFIITANG